MRALARPDEAPANARLAVSGFMLVGEAPNAATARRPDLWLLPDDSGVQHAANRLLSLAPQLWTIDYFTRLFPARDNVSPRPGWIPRSEQRRRARALAHRAQEIGVVGMVLLGARARGAFLWTSSTPDWCEWGHVEPGLDIPAAALPHPSGRNRWWNVVANRARATWFLARLADLDAS